MVKLLTAYTLELDDADLAYQELMEQLDLENKQLTYAGGLLMSHADFFTTGVAQEIAKRLPFDVVGGAASNVMVSGETEPLALSISVLTSDTVQFTAASTTISPEDWARDIEAMYAKASSSFKDAPAMVIPILPLGMNATSHDLFEALDTACGGVPIFGTVAVTTLTKSDIVCNDIYGTDIAAILLVNGPFHPTFMSESIPDNRIQQQRAVITKSHNGVLMEVNDIHVMDYFASKGIVGNKNSIGTAAIPLYIDYGDGAKPVARAFLDISDEGYAICGGRMPEGATLAVGSMEYQDVVSTTRHLAQEMAKVENPNGALIFSCGSRMLVVGNAPLLEPGILNEEIGDKMPCMYAGSASELVPVYTDDGKCINRSYSYSIIACVF